MVQSSCRDMASDDYFAPRGESASLFGNDVGHLPEPATVMPAGRIRPGARQRYDVLFCRLLHALTVMAPGDYRRECLRTDWQAWARRSGLWAAACRDTTQWA